MKHVMPKMVPKAMTVVERLNDQWALGFLHETLYSGKRFRALNVIDEVTRECLAIEADTSLVAKRVVGVLE